jgi:hypothetical protein
LFKQTGVKLVQNALMHSLAISDDINPGWI